ncbi:hypothetical protein CBR_g34707 [Chara braunii]|uniref:Selenoprotein T n=1 Tax=Chara braunii TaxID=69332 RepID=A0A388JYZ4_CHABU|nr:hypothetical protein CBR_g34707 [Chara braunii]|eukprot:GBG63008.1 hypothetical protein CBR_g34707 [Chara braunii]
MQVKGILHERFPGVPIVDTTYPAPWRNRMIANLVGAGQVAAIGIGLVGDRLPPPMQSVIPQGILDLARQNKGMFLGGAFVLGNMLRSAVLTTGAFEVYYDGKLIFSKLEQGRLPAEYELVQGLLEAMREGRGGVRRWQD